MEPRKLKYRNKNVRRRSHALPRAVEMELAQQNEQDISNQLYFLLKELASKKDKNQIYWLPKKDFYQMNSLIWIWVQMKPEMIQANIRILMAAENITSISQLAKALRMNGSFINRLVKMGDAIGFGGWNFENVYKLAKVLTARPELMLIVNLSERVWVEANR